MAIFVCRNAFDDIFCALMFLSVHPSFPYRSAGACPPGRNVARGPVPRERFWRDLRWRGTGPRPTVEEDSSVVRDRQIPNINQTLALRAARIFPYRSAGACPPRTFFLETGAWRGTGPLPTVDEDSSVVRDRQIPNINQTLALRWHGHLPIP